METAVTLFLFISLVATAIAITVVSRLFAVVMLSGVFSLLSALLLITMDAVDVAFTEAAVGAPLDLTTDPVTSKASLRAAAEWETAGL